MLKENWIFRRGDIYLAKSVGRVSRAEMEEISECIEKSLGLYIPEEMEAP